jgi:glycosyltransferase involved in cell wall biosynthesis
VVSATTSMSATNQTRVQHVAAKQRHISIVTETYPPEINGVALTLGHWVEGLRLQGYLVSLICPRQKNFDSASALDESALTLVPGLPLPGYKGLRFGLPADHILWRCWTQRRPDVVYVATEGPLGWSAVSVAQRLAIPVFSGFHTNFHSYLKHYHAGWLRPLVFRYLCWFHRRTAGTLVPSVDLCNRLRAIGLKNVSVVDRGVDSQLFNPRRRSAPLRRSWGASSNDIVALYVGRVAPEKNVDLAVEAYHAMRRFEPSVKFVVVGDGPMRAALQRKYPDIIFCGVHTDEQLAKRYASADIFLFPSETETFGNVTLEAMASGLGVVAYNYAAAAMHIRNGRTGMLAAHGNSRAFVDAATQLTRERQLLGEIRSSARAHAASVDWQRVVEAFAALLFSREEQRYATGDESRPELLAHLDLLIE